MNFGRKRKWFNNTAQRRGRAGVHLDQWERNLTHEVEPFPKSVNLGNNFTYPSREEPIENIWKGCSLEGDWTNPQSVTFRASQSDFSLPVLPVSNSSRLPIVVRGDIRFASPPPVQPQWTTMFIKTFVWSEAITCCPSRKEFKMSSSCDKPLLLKHPRSSL